MYGLIYKQLVGRSSWTRVRKNVTPCKSCLFCNICPAISNYEYAIGQYSLCSIAPS
ncbi:MAG: hypothetical protein GY765_13080 [bacterium]|nr:hypothetical protein [bacterium]